MDPITLPPWAPLRRLSIVFAQAALCVALLAGTPPAPLSAAESLQKHYDIPGGDAAVTLKLFVEQSGEQVVYLTDRVRGVRTHPAHGEMSALEALERMLARTELHVVADDKTRALIIHRAKGGPAPAPSLPTKDEAGTAPPSASSKRKMHRAPAETADGLVKLPAFSVTSDKDDSYIGKEALSTTRTGVELADLPQSVIVLNQAFLHDVNPTILAKALTYVGGAQTGTISWSVDRYMMRGFVGEGDYVDGFRTQTDKNTDLNLIERVEIIKGPSAIFIGNQANTVGGVINKISKSPTAYRIAAITVQAGRWDTNRADLDVGGPITADKKLMYRLLVAGQDSKGYYDATHEKRTSIVPMLAYQWNRDTQAWLKFESFDSRYSSYNGLPLDGRTREIAAIPWKRNLGESAPLNGRTDRFWRLWGQFSTRLNDHVAIRLAGFGSVDRQQRVESTLTPQGGTFTDGVFTPQYVIPPNYRSGDWLPRGTTAIGLDRQPRRELQNDYVFTFSTGTIGHTLLVGASLVDYPQDVSTYSSGENSTASSSPLDPFATRSPGRVWVNFHQPPANFTTREQTFSKLYVLETASFLANALILSAGASRNHFDFSETSSDHDQRTGRALGRTVVPRQALYKNLIQYGVVAKPLPHVSLFYGYNKNFSSNGLSPTHVLQPPQEGEQREFGVKAEGFGGKVSVSLSHFDVVQLNNSVPAYPQTTPPSNVLVHGTASHGFDGDFSATFNERWEVIGSFAWFEAHVPLAPPWNAIRQPYDNAVHTELPVNNASERNVALWLRYKFHDPPLGGLSIGVGVNYLHRRAITDNHNQVLYHFLPARILVDAALTYETERVKYQVNIDNLLNAKHVYAARSNQILVPGTPLNVRLAVTVKF